MSVTVLRATDRATIPWRNGGGSTSEVACEPPGAGFDAFDWRVSIAEVANAGPFSRFDGIDRVLCVLDGALMLSIDGAPPVTLTAAASPFAFAADVPVHGAPVVEDVRDLNVMLRRGRWRAIVERIDAPAEIADATADLATMLLVATQANTRIAHDVRTWKLDRFDALRIETEDAIRWLHVTAGAVIAIRLACVR